MASLATAVAQPSYTQHAASSSNHGHTPVSSTTKLRSYLSKLMRVTIVDGRIFIGSFACIDKDRNLVLVNTEEFRVGANDASRVVSTVPDGGRYVGMVMIPWKHVVGAEAEALDEHLYI